MKEIDMTQKERLLISLLLASFLTSFSSSSINVALPMIGRELSINSVTLSWISTSYLLATSVLLLPLGRISDILGRKKIYLLGIIIFSLGSLFTIFSKSITFLLSSRVMQGIGASMIYATNTAILTTLYPEEKGKFLGLNVTAVYLGLSMGPVLSGVLIQNFPWKSIFFVSFILGIITFTLSITKDDEKTQKGSIDFLGTFIYAISTILFLYGISRITDKIGVTFILLGILGIISFFYREGRVKDPVFDVKLFSKNRLFLFSNISALINYGSTSAISFLMSLYLQYIKNLPPQTTGIILLLQPMFQALFSPFAGRLSDRKDPGKIASVGMGIISLMLFSLSFIDNNTSIYIIIFALSILGFGFALFSSPNTNAIMSSVDKNSYGIASSTLATMRVIGQTLSMAIVTSIFSIILKGEPIHSESLSKFLLSTRTSFYIFTVLCIIGTFTSLIRNKSS